MPSKKSFFLGGEPLLSWSLLKRCIGYIRQHKLTPQSLVIGLITNGTLLDYTKFRLLQQFEVKITLSLDGPAKIHNHCRKFKDNKKGSFAKIENKIKMIPFKERKKIRIFTVVTPKTYKYLSATLKFIRKLGFSKINFFPNFFYEQWRNKEIEGFNKTVNNLKKHCNRIFLKNKICENFNIFSPKEKTLDSYIMQNCDKLCVDFKGNFYPCERLLGFSEREKHNWSFGVIDKDIDLSLREQMLRNLRFNLEKYFPILKLKEPYFCPFSFYFLSEQKNKKEKSINFCLAISKIYEKLFLK